MKDTEEECNEEYAVAEYVDGASGDVDALVWQARENINHLHREFLERVNDEFTVLFHKLESYFEVDED